MPGAMMLAPARTAAALLTAMLATMAASAWAHRETAPRVLAAQDVPPPRSATARAAKPASAGKAPRTAPSPYVIKRILPIDGPMRIGEHHWDDAGVPAGEILITVDLAAQVLSIFRGGYEIGAAAILYGADAKPTPLGIYPITQKDADHVSNIYHAPMPYMLRLTNDGISIHASEVQDGYMTHGCIGVPLPFAKKLFAAVKLGDRVIITRGERLSIGAPVTAG